MQWVLTAHARRYHSHYKTTGHVWEGRFKAFPIQEDEQLISVLRYVERIALRAELVAKAEDCEWSSARWFAGQRRVPLRMDEDVLRELQWDAGLREQR